MFVISVVEDKIRTLPEEFSRPTLEVLQEQIEIKYSNKIIPNVGLCISFYDFVAIGDPYVYPGQGAAHQLVEFRLVVFRPFIDEIINGKIVRSGKGGVQISMGFFDDILIPPSLLASDTEFDQSTGLWTWKYEGNDLTLEVGEQVQHNMC